MLRIGGFGNNGIVGYMMARLAKDSFGLAMAAERFALHVLWEWHAPRWMD